MPSRRVIAHRGDCVSAPEQTMAAFEQAIDRGASVLEADLRFSRDGVAVLLHDPDLDRTTNGRGPVSDMDWPTIRSLDAGSWFGDRFRGQTVPRLDDLFHLAASRGVALCIEAKGRDIDNVRAVRFAAQEIARRGRLDVDVVASFDPAVLAAATDAVGGLRVAPDRFPERGPSSAADLIAQAQRARAKIIQHHFADLQPGVVAEVQAAGIEIWAWPPATLDETQAAYDSGAIGLMGDDVAAMIEVIRAGAT